MIYSYMQKNVKKVKLKKALSNDFRIIENWFGKNMMVLNAK